ncbi:MAG: hypothetical protein D6748_04335 [Calditrichaeota bacterium]|nr:MAG: hypothetical protein D6748_04335 [Calditrichota bacterium]
MRRKQISGRIHFFWVLILISSFSISAVQWSQQESEHFIIIYRPAHAYLVPRILTSAENSLALLMKLFHYQPKEKIIINTYDFSDYGSAGTTTVPQNFIRLQIEPLELGYESMPFNERFQWLISHELVHVVINDQANKFESFFRSVFSKVPPENTNPMTILYSLLTNQERYSPRWHQEGIAVFMETWMNGGYGRILGSFDEMYFRTQVYEKTPLPSVKYLDAKTSYESFLIETLFYLFGSRFNAYLAYTYGYEKLLEWHIVEENEFYVDFEKKFKRVYGISLDEAWQDFIEAEIEFQKENIQRLAQVEPTPVTPLLKYPLGWVTSAYRDSANSSIIFGYHRPHHLTTLERINLKTGEREHLGSLPSPTILQISSTAYDEHLKLFFFTTNNNKLFRDLHVLSTASRKTKLLFRDCRVGQITVSPTTHEIWGIMHQVGKSALVYSSYPYRKLIPVVVFGEDDNLQHLSISPSGRYLAAILHQASGRQALILADMNRLRQGKSFAFKAISEDGSPENPSWSEDEKYIFWNAYINGVSNIYRYNRESGEIHAISHTITGLFKPLYLSPDTLFAFQFTSHGFQPVLIPNRPAERLPAIHYLGQKIVDRSPEVTQWVLPPSTNSNGTNSNNSDKNPEENNRYSGLKQLHVSSFVPVITGFQSQIATGIFTHISDPLFIHDLTIETAVTPKRENPVQPRFHFMGKYEYRRKYRFGLSYNAPNFYDLVNERKRGMIGTKITLGYSRFLKYDIPHKIRFVSEIALYTGIEAINDNLVRVSRPDFIVLQGAIKSNNIRRSIGNVDDEQGTRWSISGMFFGVDPQGTFEVVGGVHSEFSYFHPFLWPHNILHLKISAGYRHTKDHLSIGKFYFGGFGNRYLEKEKVKQYRKVFRLPGIPIYSLAGKRFLKGMIEHTLPPLRFGNAYLGHHHLNHIDVSWYSQGLWIASNQDQLWIDVGAQVNLVFKHWYNLESTVSAGIANTWSESGSNRAWFISLKLLKN